MHKRLLQRRSSPCKRRQWLTAAALVALVVVCSLASYGTRIGCELSHPPIRMTGIREHSHKVLKNERDLLSAQCRSRVGGSWGSSIIQDEKTGTWHVYFSAWKCSLTQWARHSEIWHGVSENTEGPYECDAAPTFPVFSNNPSIERFGGQYYLMMIGRGNAAPSPCQGPSRLHAFAVDMLMWLDIVEDETSVWRLFTASSLAGPWQPVPLDIGLLVSQGKLNCVHNKWVSNPSIRNRGELQVFYKAKDSGLHTRSRIAFAIVVIAPSNAAAQLVPLTNGPILNQQLEDPFVYEENGKWHMQTHCWPGTNHNGTACTARQRATDGKWVLEPGVSFLKQGWGTRQRPTILTKWTRGVLRRVKQSFLVSGVAKSHADWPLTVIAEF